MDEPMGEAMVEAMDEETEEARDAAMHEALMNAPIFSPEPIDEPEPMREPKPMREPEPIDEPQPMREPKPIDEPKPMREPKPVAEKKQDRRAVPMQTCATLPEPPTKTVTVAGVSWRRRWGVRDHEHQRGFRCFRSAASCSGESYCASESPVSLKQLTLHAHICIMYRPLHVYIHAWLLA